MVYFVCEGCNETLKKNQVDKHAYSCKSCHAVTCVDCQVSFYGNDYAAHTVCVSEAEKYEKSLYKPKTNAKPKAQDIWNTLIEEIVSMKSQAPAQVQPYLERLSSLSNVPRNQKKFINFARNSLNLRSDALLESLWKFLDTCRVQKEAESAAASSSASAAVPESSAAASAAAVEEAPSRKEKRKLEAVEATTVTQSDDRGDGETIEKKAKKAKKEKKEKRERSDSEKVVEEEEDKEDKKLKKDKKEKKKKEKKEK